MEFVRLLKMNVVGTKRKQKPLAQSVYKFQIGVLNVLQNRKMKHKYCGGEIVLEDFFELQKEKRFIERHRCDKCGTAWWVTVRPRKDRKIVGKAYEKKEVEDGD